MAFTSDPMRPVRPKIQAKLLSRREAYGLIVGLAFGWVIVFGGMSAINPLLPFLRAEFRLSGSETGAFTSLFSLPYLIMQIPGGLLADRFGAKRILVLMLLLAGISRTVSGLLTFGLFTFVPVMMIYRTGCSVYYPTSFGASVGVVPAKEHGLVAALLTMGTAFGGALGTDVAVPLYYMAGGVWRFPFLIFGLLTLALPVLFLLLKWPKQQASTSSFSGLASVFKDPTVITLLMVNLASNYGSSAVFVWGPSFLGTERGLSPVQAGYYIAMVNFIGFPAGVGSGILSDRFGRRTLTIFLFLAGGLSVVMLAWVESPLFVLGATLSYGVFGKWTADGPLTAWLGDHTTRKYPTMA